MVDAKIRGEIDAGNRQLAEALQKQSASRMAALYAENATFVGPDGTPVAGRKAIEEMWTSQIGAGLRAVDLKTISVEDLAPGMFVELGTYTVTVGEAKDSGRYMVIWKRSAKGSLELYVDVPASHAAQ